MSFAKEFIEMLNRFQSIPKEVYDDELRKEILKTQIELIEKPVLKFPPYGKSYFSPSSANSMQRELVHKVLKAPRDEQAKHPYMKRWQDMGTRFGDYIQETVLFIEKHYPRLFGEESPFYFERTDRGYPAFEEAIKKCSEHEYNGHTIRIFGQSDGILIHRETGTRVILEVKSKQTTHGATGYFKMKEPSSDHSRQVVAYSLQHHSEEKPLGDAIIFYGNLSKKGWDMSEEEIEKHPDIRAFDVKITENDRNDLLGYFSEVLEYVAKGELPKIDLYRWTFCNFKKAIANSLTSEELDDIKKQVRAFKNSSLPDYKKKQYNQVLVDLVELCDE